MKAGTKQQNDLDSQAQTTEVPNDVVGVTKAQPKRDLQDGAKAPELSWWHLNFRQPALELKFRRFYSRKKLQIFRIALPCLLVVTGLLAIADPYLLNDCGDCVEQYRIIRLAIQIPLCVIAFCTSFTTWYRSHYQPANTTFALSYGAMNIALSIIGKEPTHGPHMLYMALVYFFLQLRAPFSTSVCSVLFVAFVAGVREFVPNNDKFLNSVGYLAMAHVALALAAFTSEYWVRLDFVRQQLMQQEEERTNNLLHDLLPERITAQLKMHDNPIAEQIDNVSILFSDLAGFTAYSATISAREVVEFLNTLYSTFDHLTVVNQVLKVETIGDAYFIASGVENPRTDHAELLANFAFDMVFIMRQFMLPGGHKLKMRIGIHTGSVIAGVVGVKVPRYHLFGDDVVIANLMESSGVPDQIQISQTTFAELDGKDGYVLTYRHEIDLGERGGRLKTYWLRPAGEDEELVI